MLPTNAYPEYLKYIHITVILMQKQAKNTSRTLGAPAHDVVYVLPQQKKECNI